MMEIELQIMKLPFLNEQTCFKNSKNICNMEIISAKCKNANLDAGLLILPCHVYYRLCLKEYEDQALEVTSQLMM